MRDTTALQSATLSASAGKFSGLDRHQAAEAWKFENPDIEHSGKKIVLPADPGDMAIPEAIEHLKKLDKANNTPSNPSEFIVCFPFDGLVAFRKAIDHLFGFAVAEMKMTAFGPVPPQPMSIQTGYKPDDFLVVPSGEFSIPALPKDDRIGVKFERNDDGFGIIIYAKTTRKYENVVREIAKATREMLKLHSIYRSKAFRLHTSDGAIDLARQPEFINVDKIKLEDLHLNEDIMAAVTTSIFTPIEHTDKCKAFGVPLKRGVLLEGPYGGGKSLISTITAKKCEENGWTFITIEETDALADVLLLARQFQPCVVFAEDLDRNVGLDRDDHANMILNTVDGVLSKSAEVMVVFTTNHVENIAKPMLRPGRLDSVITIAPPNAGTIVRLIHYYGRGMVEKGIDLTRVTDELVGQIPATIREVVERSKLHAIPRATGSQLALRQVTITEPDLYATAKTMTRHLELLNVDNSPKPTPAEQVLSDLGSLLNISGSTTDSAVASVTLKHARNAHMAADGAHGHAVRIEKKVDAIKEIIDNAAN